MKDVRTVMKVGLEPDVKLKKNLKKSLKREMIVILIAGMVGNVSLVIIPLNLEESKPSLDLNFFKITNTVAVLQDTLVLGVR